jgi:predicted nicotinamide N-methyase
VVANRRILCRVDAAEFVLTNTRQTTAPLVPEVGLRLADEPFALWELTGSALPTASLPYWAFAWAGGQALARYVLDHRDLVAGRSVLDLASGSGLVAIAAALAGAREVIAVDIDPLAVAAIGVNASACGVEVSALCADVLDTTPGADWTARVESAEVVLAGDVCYDRVMAQRVIPFATRAAARGALVLLGDPGRAHFPATGFDAVGQYEVQVTGVVEADDTTPTTVWRCRPSPARG